MPPHKTASGPLPITDALRRVVVGFRVVSAGWLMVLAVVAAVGGLHAGAVAGPMMVALGWTMVTVSAYRQERLADTRLVVADVAIAVALVIWQAAVGSQAQSFLGGYPFSSVVLVAAMRGMVLGLGAATALSVASVGSATLISAPAGGIGVPTLTSTVLLYAIGAATVAWGAGVIRRHDERARAVEAALADERAERVRSQERADTGAHLHDSVLQVLALIQRRAHDAEEVSRLARGQERSLRAWLEDDRRDVGASVARQLDEVAAEVEELHQVSVDVVTVGDAPATAATTALVAAAREALVNAARHAGVESVSVFLQTDDDGTTVYVRDRGAGFDPAEAGAGHRGVRESIRGRMARHGGEAHLRTAPGRGTEWTLRVGTGERKGAQ